MRWGGDEEQGGNNEEACLPFVQTTSGPEGTQDSTALVDLTDSAPDLLEKQVSSHEFHVVQGIQVACDMHHTSQCNSGTVEGQPSFQTLHQLYQVTGTLNSSFD